MKVSQRRRRKINMYTDYFGLIIPVSSMVLATIMLVITSYYIGIS